MPGPDSEYNIAKNTEIFKSAWSEGLYDLRKYEPGYCFTYDPPTKSKSGINDGLYILLGHEKLIQPFTTDTIYKRDSSYVTHSFEIYLHDKVGVISLKNKCAVLEHLILGAVLVEVRYVEFWSIRSNCCSSKKASDWDLSIEQVTKY